jgi:Mg-chelatase subunit ChlI
MKHQLPNLPSTLVERYQDLRDALNAFTTEAADIHSSVPVTNEATRAVFTALSRITAYSDQMNMVMALMGEDVRVAEEIGAGPGIGPQFETADIENCFYEWLRTSRKGGLAVH